MARLLKTVAGIFAAPLILLTPVSGLLAQYSIDMRERYDPNFMQYFGSAKDENGTLLGDVTFQLQSGRAIFVFVTDRDGRFRGSIPRTIAVESISTRCQKRGFETVSLVKRPNLRAARPSVQLDCRLRRKTA